MRSPYLKPLLLLFMFPHEIGNPSSVPALDVRVFFPVNVFLMKLRASLEELLHLNHYELYAVRAVLCNLGNCWMKSTSGLWVRVLLFLFPCGGITWNVLSNSKVMTKYEKIWMHALHGNRLFSTRWLRGCTLMSCTQEKTEVHRKYVCLYWFPESHILIFSFQGV